MGKPVERTVRKFKALQVPKKLQKELPFKTKPKLDPKQKRKTYEQKRAVVMEPDEKKAVRLMHEIFTANRANQEKKRKKEVERQEGLRDQRVKEQRKRVFRMIGKQEKKAQAGAGGKRR